MMEFVSDLFDKEIGGRQVVGKPYREAFPEFAEQGFADLFEDILETGVPQTGRGVRVDVDEPDGTRRERYFDFVWHPMTDPDGHIEGVITHAVEVTDAQLARREAEEAQAQYSALVHDLDVMVWELELEQLTFTFVSAQAERLTGYAPGEWRDFGFWKSLVHPEDRQIAAETCMLSTAAGEDHRLEYRILHKDGHIVWIDDIVRVVRDESGTPRQLRGVLVDVTRRKELEENQALIDRRLREVQKLESLGLMAGGIAHDFNNLLTGILGNASVALMDLSASHPARARIEALSSAARRAAELAGQMLAYSGRGHFEVRTIDLRELLDELQLLLQSTLPAKVQLRLEIGEDLPLVDADPTQLQQVFMNLVINGAEAVGDSVGTVIVSADVKVIDGEYAARLHTLYPLAPGRYLTVEVHDSGCGMDAETMAQMFDPFFTTKPKGHGLGLAAVSGIVRGHGGGLRVYSSPGGGTTIKVYLPASGEAGVTTERAPTRPTPGNGRVLVVDDEEDVRIAARAMLERMGFEVLEACDGGQGVEVFREHHESLAMVLLDMTMPVLSGEEAFLRFREVNPKVPIVLSSGYNQLEATRRFTGKGLAGFLQKPYTVDELAAALDLQAR